MGIEEENIRKTSSNHPEKTRPEQKLELSLFKKLSSGKFKKVFNRPIPKEYYGGPSIDDLIEKGVPLELIKSYGSRFKNFPFCIEHFIQWGIPPSFINLYSERFIGVDVQDLILKKIPPAIANAYAEKGHVFFEIIALLRAGILPEQMNKLKDFNAYDIIILSYAGVEPETLSNEQQRRLHLVLKRIITRLNRTSEELSFLGVGSQGIVVRNNVQKTAYKFSKDLSMEISLLKKVKHYQKNARIIRIEKIIGRGIVDIIELEYISGRTLADYLERGLFSSEKNMKYSKCIFEGLSDLHDLKIYHRDLWLGNIMIDEVKDRAVIIDLGIATDDPEEGPKDNRRYGGENDLQSLGQIMYKMVTGHHLFNFSICMSTHLIPDAVKAERERVYADSASLERRLKQVGENVPNKKVAGIIQMCLTAKGSDEDYKMLEERFKEYVSD